MKLLLIILFSLGSMSYAATTTPVQFVDLNKYLGDWYEIATIPQFFSKDCLCTRATYGLKDNGKISVYNMCRKKKVDGKISDVKGTAKVVDKQSNAKLKVSFFWPFYGDYWIIGLDSDYRYAVVSNSDGSTFWILSRTPKLDPILLAEALAIGKQNGIDFSKLQYTTQEGCW